MVIDGLKSTVQEMKHYYRHRRMLLFQKKVIIFTKPIQFSKTLAAHTSALPQNLLQWKPPKHL